MSYRNREEIPLNDISILVGPNGAGKTNVVRAILLLNRIFIHDIQIKDIQSYAYDPSKPFTIELEIDLSSEEKQILREWLAIALSIMLTTSSDLPSSPQCQRNLFSSK
jgi:AAA15 family ATPase/GTPase